MVSKSRKKIHQTWGPPFSGALYSPYDTRPFGYKVNVWLHSFGPNPPIRSAHWHCKFPFAMEQITALRWVFALFAILSDYTSHCRTRPQVPLCWGQGLLLEPASWQPQAIVLDSREPLPTYSETNIRLCEKFEWSFPETCSHYVCFYYCRMHAQLLPTPCTRVRIQHDTHYVRSSLTYKLVNLYVGWESSFPLSVASRPATRPSKLAAEPTP